MDLIPLYRCMIATVAFANATITSRQYHFFQCWEQLRSSPSANLVFTVVLSTITGKDLRCPGLTS